VLTSVRVPREEYLATSYRPDCDYVDGELLERNVGEWEHSRLQMLLSQFLFSLEAELGILVVPEQRVQVRPTRFRIPDIAVLTAAPSGPVVQDPPFLCIEILSRRDRVEEMQVRVDDYLEFGVQYVWLIDPRTKQAWVHTRKGVTEAGDGVLCTESPRICVRLGELA